MFPWTEYQNVISRVTWDWGTQHECKNIRLCFCSCRRLESPTRTLTLEAPKGVEVNAGVGEFRASCRKELTLESSEGEVSNLLVLVERSHGIALLPLRYWSFIRHMDRTGELALSRMWTPAVLCCLMAINNVLINDDFPWTQFSLMVVHQVRMQPHSFRVVDFDSELWLLSVLLAVWQTFFLFLTGLLQVVWSVRPIGHRKQVCDWCHVMDWHLIHDVFQPCALCFCDCSVDPPSPCPGLTRSWGWMCTLLMHLTGTPRLEGSSRIQGT